MEKTDQIKEDEMFQWYWNQSKKILSWVSHIRVLYPSYYFSSSTSPTLKKNDFDKDLYEIQVIQEDVDFQMSQMEKGNLPPSPTSNKNDFENLKHNVFEIVELNEKEAKKDDVSDEKNQNVKEKKEYFLSQFEKQAHQFVNKKMKGKVNQRELALSLERWREIYQKQWDEKMKENLIDWIENKLELLPHLPFSVEEMRDYELKKIDEKDKKKLWTHLKPEEKKMEWNLFILRILQISYVNLSEIPKELYKDLMDSLEMKIESWEKHIVWDKNDKLISHYKKLYWDNENHFWDIEYMDPKVDNVKKNVSSLFKKK